MRILFAEDDREQLEPRRQGVDGVQDGQTTQLLILEWMLANVSRLELGSRYRRQGKRTPILWRMAKDTTADKVMGLDAVADDYLIKAVDGMELLARVRALGRRCPQWQGDQLQLQDGVLGLPSTTLPRGDRALPQGMPVFEVFSTPAEASQLSATIGTEPLGVGQSTKGHCRDQGSRLCP